MFVSPVYRALDDIGLRQEAFSHLTRVRVLNHGAVAAELLLEGLEHLLLIDRVVDALRPEAVGNLRSSLEGPSTRKRVPRYQDMRLRESLAQSHVHAAEASVRPHNRGPQRCGGAAPAEARGRSS